MTDKEKEAINQVDWIRINFFDKKYGETFTENEYSEYYEALCTVLNLIQTQQEEIEDTKKAYYSLINKIENKIDKFDYEFEKAKRNNDNDRADYYWDLIIKFKKLLESEGKDE